MQEAALPEGCSRSLVTQALGAIAVAGAQGIASADYECPSPVDRVEIGKASACASLPEAVVDARLNYGGPRELIELHQQVVELVDEHAASIRRRSCRRRQADSRYRSCAAGPLRGLHAQWLSSCNAEWCRRKR